MILIYTMLLVVLATICFLTKRRVARLEKKYSRTARDVEKLSLGHMALRQGNSNSKLDSLESVKRQYLLGQLVQKRDALETKCHAWQARAERFGRWLTAVREWKGRTLPYTMGVLDVSGALYLIDYLGVGRWINFQNIVQLLSSSLGW
jgi:hypothetical protein